MNYLLCFDESGLFEETSTAPQDLIDRHKQRHPSQPSQLVGLLIPEKSSDSGFKSEAKELLKAAHNEAEIEIPTEKLHASEDRRYASGEHFDRLIQSLLKQLKTHEELSKSVFSLHRKTKESRNEKKC